MRCSTRFPLEEGFWKKDDAFTDEIQVLKYDHDDNSVTIDGWVASANPNAHMPGYGDE